MRWNYKDFSHYSKHLVTMEGDMAAKLRDFVNVGKKIVGAGLNYNALLAIQKVEKPKEPVIFLKPTSSYITEGRSIVLPPGFKVNHEVELGVIIGKECKNVDEKCAMDFVGGYCLALDMTATSELVVARSKGLPWCIGKGFDTACPVSKFVPKDQIPDPHNVKLWCTVNGQTRQEGNTSDLIFDVPKLISYVSKFMVLEPCDLILTGSPPGMAPVVNGDRIEAGMDSTVVVKFDVCQ